MKTFETHCYIDDLPCRVLMIDYELQSIVFQSNACQLSRTFNTINSLGFSIEQLQKKLLTEKGVTLAEAIQQELVITKSFRLDHLITVEGLIKQFVFDEHAITLSKVCNLLEQKGVDTELTNQYIAILGWPEKNINGLMVKARTKVVGPNPTAIRAKFDDLLLTQAPMSFHELGI